MSASIFAQTKGNAGTYAATLQAAFPEFPEFGREAFGVMAGLSQNIFNGGAPVLPLLVTTTSPFGGAIGLCHMPSRAARIWIKQSAVADGTWPQVLLHEMLHASLSWGGRRTKHDGAPWVDEIARISELLGQPIKVARVTPRKVAGKSVRLVKPGHLTQAEIGRWPHSISLHPETILRAAGA